MEETKLHDVLKQAVMEAIDEKREFFRSIIEDEIEDVLLGKLIERDSEGPSPRIIGSIVDYTWAANDGNAFARRVADPSPSRRRYDRPLIYLRIVDCSHVRIRFYLAVVLASGDENSPIGQHC